MNIKEHTAGYRFVLRKGAAPYAFTLTGLNRPIHHKYREAF